MKLKAILAALVAGAALVTSCEQPFEPTYLDEIKVSSSYIALPVEGGSVEVTLDVTGDWSISGVGTGDDEIDWITVSPMSGAAGEDIVLTFSAEADDSGRSGSIYINCGNQQQVINLIQGIVVPQTVTVAQVIEDVNNGTVGKLYQVTGVCTAIADTSYGNWYLNDGTGEIYIYGTVNASGSYDWESFDIEVGDEVTVQGRSTLYGSTLEFVDATWISTNKTLISVDATAPEDAVLPIGGGEFSVTLENKGDGLEVAVPEDAQSWLSIASIGGTTSNPVVTFLAAANTGVDRETTITFITHDSPAEGGPKEYSITAGFVQEGTILDSEVSALSSVSDGLTRYRIEGTLSQDSEGDIYFRDYTGDIQVYGIVPGYDEEGNELSDWESLGAEVGDVVALVARKSSYNGNAQLIDAFVESVLIEPTAISVADFNAAAEDDTWYLLKGVVENVANTQWGNLDLADESGSVYVYGVDSGFGGNSGQFSDLDVAVGDTLTIVGHRSSYRGDVQVADAFFVKVDKQPVELPDLPEEGTAEDPYSVASALEIFESGAWTVYANEDAYFKGTICAIEEVAPSFGNATYYISDDGTTDGEQLYIYRGYYFGSEKFTAEDQIKVGDKVVVCGKMTVYNDTYEIASGNYIYSLNGATE